MSREVGCRVGGVESDGMEYGEEDSWVKSQKERRNCKMLRQEGYG